MEGNGVIQLINYILENVDIMATSNISGMIAIKDDPGYKTIAVEAFANGLVTFIVTGISAYIGSQIGSKNTVKLYKAEEKFKVKESLRREFYFEYEKIYLEIYNNLEKTIEKIKSVRMDVFFYGDEDHYDNGDMNKYIKVEKINNIKDIEKFLENSKVKEMFNSINELHSSMKMLKNLMEVKGYIHKYEEFKYSDLESIINKAKTKCRSMEATPKLMESIRKRYEHVSLPKGVNLQVESPGDIKKFVENLESIINKILVDLIKQLNNSNKIHNKINVEFIGNYFED